MRSTRRTRRHASQGSAARLAARRATVPEEIDDGSLRGEFLEQSATYDDGTSGSTYFWRVNGNDRDVRELVFDVEPDLLSQTQVKVWGSPRDGRIAVRRMEEVVPGGTPGTSGQALIGTPPIEPTKMAMAVVNTVAGGTPNMMPDAMTQRLFTNADSVKNYYIENSFGMHDLTGKVVSAILDYPMVTCDTMGLATALRPMVDADVGGASDVYLWYFGERVTACAWGWSRRARHLLQRDIWLRGARPGAGSLVRPDALVELDLPHRRRRGATGADPRRRAAVHAQRVRKPVRHDGQRLPSLQLVPQGLSNVPSPVQHRERAWQRDFHHFPDRKGVRRNPGPAGPDAQSPPVHELGRRRHRCPQHPASVLSGGAPSATRVRRRPTWSASSSSMPRQFSVLATGMRRAAAIIWLLDNNPVATTARDGTDYGLAQGQTFTDPAGGSRSPCSVTADGANIKVDITGPLLDGGAPNSQPASMARRFRVQVHYVQAMAVS